MKNTYEDKECFHISLPEFSFVAGSRFDWFEFENYLAPSSGDRESCIAICDGITDILSALFNISGQQMRSPKRQCTSVIRVRQIGMYLAHVSLGVNLNMVADGFGRTKSTVTHACKMVENMRDDTEFDQVITRVERIVYVAFGVRRSAQ